MELSDLQRWELDPSIDIGPSMYATEFGDYVRYDDVVAAERELLEQVAELTCPNAAGFEGPETFPDCGTCIVCRARKAISP